MKFIIWLLVASVVLTLCLGVFSKAVAQPVMTDPSDCQQLEQAVEYFLKVDAQFQADAATLKATGIAHLKKQLCLEMASVKTKEDFRIVLDSNNKIVVAVWRELSGLLSKNGNLERLRSLPDSGDTTPRFEQYMSTADVKIGNEILYREAEIGGRQRVLGWVFLQITGTPYSPPE